MAELTPRHQAIRSLVATIDPSRFDDLKAGLEQSRAMIDARLALLEAERLQLATRKHQLDVVIETFSKPNALGDLRSAMLKGERLGDIAKREGSKLAPKAKPRPSRASTPQRRRSATQPPSS